ncbi:MAG: CvpA family protein [Acidobacteriaceae bacterium]|nr:CvpA family protein [Acidobacteriaceae bacterium]
MTLNPLDWILAAVLTYSVVRALFRGFVREAFALGGLIVGVGVACWGYQAAALKLKGLINSTPLSQFLAFALLLFGVMALSTLLAHLIRKTASAVGLGFLDRLLGGLFGLLRGAVLAGAMLMAITAFLPSAPWIRESTLSPYFLRAAHAVSFTMPTDLKTRLRSGIDQIKHTNPDWIKFGTSSHTGNSSR